MKVFITTDAATLRCGMIKLTNRQAEKRMHRLKQTDSAGVFEIMEPIQFKSGETFGFEGDIPKEMEEAVKSHTGDSDKVDEKPADRRGRQKKIGI